MPAPRLLDKKLVNASLAQERKQEIDKGVKLAQKIDALRETLGQEEEKLERFRRETVIRVQIEIDTLIRERDRLLKEVQTLQVTKEEHGRK